MKTLIGVTGPSGSGKTTLCKILSNNLDIDCIELDKYRKEFLSLPIIKKTLKLFYKKGKTLKDENFNANTIAATIKDPKKWQKGLASWTIHRFMLRRLKQDLKKSKSKIVIIESELLPQLKIFEKCDLKVLVDAPQSVCVKNIAARDNVTQAEVMLGKKYRLAKNVEYKNADFDFVFDSLKFKTEQKRLQQSIQNLTHSKEQKQKTP